MKEVLTDRSAASSLWVPTSAAQSLQLQPSRDTWLLIGWHPEHCSGHTVSTHHSCVCHRSYNSVVFHCSIKEDTLNSFAVFVAGSFRGGWKPLLLLMCLLHMLTYAMSPATCWTKFYQHFGISEFPGVNSNLNCNCDPSDLQMYRSKKCMAMQS